MALLVKKLPASARDVGTGAQSLGGGDPLEEGTATHSSVLAWRIPWTEEPGGLQSMGSQRVRHDRSDLARMQDAWCLVLKTSLGESLQRTGD